MTSCHESAPEVPGVIDANSSDSQWSAAVRCDHEFVYESLDEAGQVLSRHLMEWNPRPTRHHATGITASARVLESHPCLSSHGRGGSELRIHVCRHTSCAARKTIQASMDQLHAQLCMDASSIGGEQPGASMPAMPHQRSALMQTDRWSKQPGSWRSKKQNVMKGKASYMPKTEKSRPVFSGALWRWRLQGVTLVYGKCCVGVDCSKHDADCSWQRASSTLLRLSLQMCSRTRGRGGRAPMS